MSNRRYVLVSPCRDEAEHMRRTLDSVMAQSSPPTLWVVVDDGSTDETPAILESYRSRMPYLKIVRRANRGKRSVGPGVIEAFTPAWKPSRSTTSTTCASSTSTSIFLPATFEI